MTDGGLTAAFFTECRPRAIAALMRSFRDLDTAEDLFQAACLKAAERWQRDGLPTDPLAWLIRVARNAGIDRVRKTQRLTPLDSATLPEADAEDSDHEAKIAEAIDRAECRDDVLRLMFMCCHPSLPAPDQLALTLKVVAGLSVEEIARAFLVTGDTMQRRISRARARAAETGVRLETPSRSERAERLSAVQTTVYLLFNEGYAASAGDVHVRQALCDEAIRLARLLLDLFPAQPQLMALLALCLLQHARRRARIDAAGDLVSLEQQDRALWDRAEIAEGLMLVEKALRKGRPGALQIQAAIAAVHCRASRAADTDWPEIERLYAALLAVSPGPVIGLNHAVAISKTKGPQAGLAALAGLEDALERYKPFHAVRAGLLEETGDFAGALAALTAALALSPTNAEARYIEDKIGALQEKI